MEKNNVELESNIATYYNQNLFKGKVLVLTGGTSKMLFQIAHDFMILGGQVALISRRLPELQQVCNKLKELTKGKALPYELNLKSHEKFDEVIEKIIADFGRIDVLVNGAAGNFLAFSENLSYNAFKTVLEIDTLATFYMSKTVFVKWMKKNGGSVINISANLHHMGTLMNSHASAAKAGVDAITKTLALEWGPYKVKVNGVSPGFIEGTEGFDRLSDPQASKSNNYSNQKDLGFNRMKSMIPAQRYGNKNDISKAVLFLASDLSSYITGQTFEVDGGQKAVIPNPLILLPSFESIWKPKF